MLGCEGSMKLLKVSEIASIAGVSVRTLHYYEEVGLLEPERTAAGHRRYGRAAIERLQQIRSLRQLGFSLAKIDSLFAERSAAPEQVLAAHLAEVQVRRAALTRLETQLRQLLSLLASGQTNNAEAVDVLLNTLEAMKMYEKHLTPDQQQQISALHEGAGEAAANWKAALDGLRAEMKAGTDPADPKVQQLAKHWHQAAAAFMPADDEVTHEAAMRLLHDEPQARHDHGLDDALFAYLGEVLAPTPHTGK